jgi:hypothetical protein
MIVVVGLPAYTDAPDGQRCAGGLAVEVAAEASGRGAAVELAGKVGGDGAGDAVVVALGRMGVGHAALLRDPALPTPVLLGSEPAAATGADPAATIGAGADPVAHPEVETDADSTTVARILPDDPAARPGLDSGDVELALRYLAGPRVVVVVEPLGQGALAAAAEGAAFAGAHLIVLASPPDGSGPDRPPASELLPDDAIVLEAPARDDGSFSRFVGSLAAAIDAGADPSAAFRASLAETGWEASAG